MKHKPLALLTLLTLMFSLIPLSASAATSTNTNNFYFDSFSADYYLARNADGTSSLGVLESLTAVFPDTDQNHGINRVIPTTNQNNKNYTMDPKAINISVTRNGEPEPIAKVTGDDTYHDVYIGDATSYVHGRQEYTLSYLFEKVITSYYDSDTSENQQELYWDTNGTGFSQRFDSLTARLHLDEASRAGWTGEAWCYVGRNKSSDQSRCEWTETEDGVIEFTATGALSAGENLTFDLTFADGTFVVPAPPASYTPLWLSLAIFVLAIATIIIICVIYSKHKDKYRTWKDTFIAPEYQPIKHLTISEVAMLSTSARAQYTHPATLIELAVTGHIKLKEGKPKAFKKPTWTIEVVSTKDLIAPQLDALAILNAGVEPKSGEKIEIKSRTATSAITKAQNDFTNHTKTSLIGKRLFLKSNLASYSILIPIALFFLTVFLGAFATEASETTIGAISMGEEFVAPAIIFSIAVTIWASIMCSRIQKVGVRTELGLKVDRRLEGLKLFIKMAETDRIKFFQSAKTAQRIDTTDGKQMVKLYEKLLPYAIIFGLEKTWSKQLQVYYDQYPTMAPAWYFGTRAFSAAAFSDSLHSITTSVSHSVSSSSSSGAGGGGFSGGGGGGGGGGGW